MTISSTTRKAGPFDGNDVTTSFPFTFKVFSTGDIAVVRTMPSGIEETLVLDSDYSVTLNGDQDANPGGTITYPVSGAPLPADWRLTAVGDLDNLQPTDITNGGGFYPQVIENALDRVTMLLQQLDEEVDRTIRIAVSDNSTEGLELPAQDGRAARILGFDADGNFTTYERATATVQTTYQQFTATAGRTSFTLPNTYTPGANSLYVWLNGAKLISGTHFTETTSTSFTLTTGAQAGDSIEAIAGVPIVNGTVINADMVTYIPRGTGAQATTVQGKLREIVTPEDFGAVGDGVTDDTTALRKWAAADAGVHLLGDESKTYLVAPPVAGDIIIPLTAARRIIGAGAKIKVKDASGQFTAIMGSNDFGVDLSHTVVAGVVFDHNKANNTYTVTANVLDNAHFTFVARNGTDISFVDNTVLDPVCTNSVFINGVSAGVALIKRPRVNRNRFLAVGGSATAHDHSTIYITGDDCEIVGNYGYADSLGATGSACFLEPHSTKMNICDNSAYDFEGIANITGIYRAGDTDLSIVSRNKGIVQQFGIRLFSGGIGDHTTGFGINGMDVVDNHIRILQQSLPAGTNRTYIGVSLQSGSTLPVANVRIKNNFVEYQLDDVAYSYNALCAAIGVNEGSFNETFENIEISDNTVINAPGPAIALGFGNGTFVNCEIGRNRLVNPGQGLNAALASYKAAVWLGGNNYSGSLKIGRQTVVDNIATSRLQFGIYAAPAVDSTACTVDAEIDVTLTGDKASFLRPYANISNRTLPTLTAKLNKAPLLTSHTFKVGSIIEDTVNALTYRIQVQGSAWTTHGFASAAPTSGTHQVGSTRTNTVPTAGGNIGWVCVTAGVPGTWKTYGAIAP